MSTDIRDRLRTVDERGRRIWVYADIARGTWRTRRQFVAIFLMVIYLIIPWLKNGDNPLLQFDIMHQTLWVFGQSLGLNETAAVLGIILGFIFFILALTAVAGRAWCGWACPQTVFLEFLYRPFERWIEGYPTSSRNLNASKMTWNKFKKKSIKWIFFGGVSFIIANSFVAYFVGSHELIQIVTKSPNENFGLFSLMLLIFIGFLFNFGWFREQMCTIACPYGRFQSVLLDRNSIVVGYDQKRGEPRGKAKGGDCVDCNRCVQVCPTGIDIRNGVQLECINCTACIDACNVVMEKIDRPKNLIGYTTENKIQGKQTSSTKVVRPILYSLASLLFLSLAGYKVLARSTFEVMSSRAQTGQISTEGANVRNQLSFSLKNDTKKHIEIKIEPLEQDIQITLAQNPITLEPKSKVSLQIFVGFERSVLMNGVAKKHLAFESKNQRIVVETVLLGPEGKL